jgi:glycosyltransferase involved in cell wall biosynthesis
VIPNADGAGSRPKISVVVPVFNEEGNLEDLRSGIGASLEGEPGDYEVVLVDNASTTCSRRFPARRGNRRRR